MTLSDKHLADLQSSGLNDDMIRLGGFHSAPRIEIKSLLHFDCGSAGLVIPYPFSNGTGPAFCRVKPDRPFADKKNKSRKAKYLSPRGAANRIYFPAIYNKTHFSNVALPIIFVEGEKKCCKGAQELHDFLLIGLAGVQSWKIRGAGLIPDFDRLTLQKRQVYIAYDSDIVGNPNVRTAEKKFAEALAACGAFVRLVRIPSAANGNKQGLDDYLLSHSAEDFVELLKSAKSGHARPRTISQTRTTNDPGKENSEDDAPKPTPSLKNAVRAILEHKLTNIWFDDFLSRPMTGDPPCEWTDADDLELCIRLQSVRGFSKIGLETVRNAALTIAFRNHKNCVKDWLNSLRWDKEPRIDHVFEEHFGAVDTKYTRAASRNFWISMVARVDQPGCKVDNMVVLEGDQGKKKSSALDIIGGSWFAEQHENVTSREFFQVLQGKLLIEISELDAFSRSDVTKVKQVVSCRSDRYREPYGRHAKDHPRQCVFVGTTNKDDWNRDETGGRRFWPIACRGDIDLDAIRAAREQCFAEAVFRFKKGQSWWEMPADETRTEQASRYIPPAWAEPIEKYITHEWIENGDGSGGFHWSPRTPRTELSVSEILEYALDIPKSQWSKANEMRVGEALRVLGWIKKDVRRDGRIVKRWLPPEGGNAAEGGNA